MPIVVTNTANLSDDANRLINAPQSVTSVVAGGTTYVVVVGYFDNGLSVFRLEANGSLTPVFDLVDAGLLEIGGPLSVESATVDGVPYLYVGGREAGFSVLQVNGDGSLTPVQNVIDDATTLLSDQIFASETVTVGGASYLYVASASDNGITIYGIETGGALTLVGTVADSSDAAYRLTGLRGLEAVTVGGNTFLLAAGRDEDAINVFQVEAGGNLTFVSAVDDAGALELDGATDIVTATIGGITYVYVAGTMDSGLSVFSLSSTGILSSVQNISDDVNMRLGNAQSLTVIDVGTSQYVAVSGYDFGISLFRIGSDGTLTHDQAIADDATLHLGNDNHLTSVVVGGVSYLISISAAGGSDNGISVLQLAAPPPIAPTLDLDSATDGSDNVASYTEQAPVVTLASGIVIQDPDSATLTGASVRIVGGSQSGDGYDYLGIGGSGVGTINGISYSYTVLTGILTLTGDASVADYQAVLAQVTFQSTLDNPGTSRTISWTVNDGTADSAAVTTALAITPVNDAPVIGNLNGDSVAFTEGGVYLNLDAGGNAAVSDVDSANFDGGSLTVAVTGNEAAGEDALALSGGAVTIPVDGQIAFNDVVFATYTGYATAGADLVFTFNANATPEAVQALLRGIAYRNGNQVDPSTAQRTVTFTLLDGDGGTTVVTSVVNVVAVDEAPVAVDDTATVAENGIVIIDVTGNDTDVDGGPRDVAQIDGIDAPVGIAITLASGATATNNGDGTITYDPDGAFDNLPAQGSGASNTSAPDSFTYTLNGGSSATVSVTVTGTDSDDTLIGTSGDDMLDGGAGADTMSGGLGNDGYVVDQAGPGPLQILVNYDYGDIVSGNSLAPDLVNPAISASSLTIVGALSVNTFNNHFYVSGWGTTLDPTKYYETTLTPNGQSIDFGAVSFGMEQSGGVTSGWVLRSSLDNFTGDIATGTVLDDNTTSATVDLTGLAAASGPITFRWYFTTPSSGITVGFANHQAPGTGFGAEAPGLDLSFSGSVIAEDQVIENAGEGDADYVETTVAAYTLPDNVEQLYGLNGTGQALTGNALDNLVGGNAGDDMLDGADGIDTALFSGNRDDYDVTDNGDGTYTFVDSRNGSPDGTDVITNFEFARFADGTRAIAALFNEAPVVDLDAGAAGIDDSNLFVEGSPPSGLGTDIVVTDVNGDDIVRAVVTITDPVAGDTLVYNLPLPAGITVDPASTATILILIGAASASAYQDALGQLGFTSSSDDPTLGGTDTARTITVTVNDGTVDSAPATMTLTVSAVDDAPVAQPDAFVITENGTIVAGNLFANNGSGTDSDPDGPPLAISAVNGSGANVGTQIVLGSGALLTVNANGTFDYDPNGAFDPTPTPGSGASNTPGHDGFSYTLAGGNTVSVMIALTGLDTDDLLLGTAGADVLIGGNGNDTYIVEQSADQVVEAAGGGTRDVVYTLVNYSLAAGSEVEVLSTSSQAGLAALVLVGNEFGQEIYGNAGDNFLQGGGGTDYLVGFGGNDTYFVAGPGEHVVEGAGGGTRDIIYTPGDYVMEAGVEVEVLSSSSQAGTTAQTLIGNSFAQEIYGNAGANFIEGGGGADVLIGLGGDDTYLVDSADDYVGESAGGGRDVVYATASYTLAAGQEIEVLSTASQAGTAAIDLTGNEFGNTIYGNAGANILDGGAGADYMQGFGGNDNYYVDHAADAVIEGSGGGNDSVYTSVSYALGAGQEIELLLASDFSATSPIQLTGNELVNTIYGNAGDNWLDGKGGSDLLVGQGGADTYAFTTALGPDNVDVVFGFVSGVDRIALDDAVFTALGAPGALNASAFVTGSAAADADDRIVYNSATGQLFYDADGNGVGAQILFATLTSAPALIASDFMVI